MPTLPITLTPPPTSNLGICYYHESMGYLGRTTAQIAQDLSNIAKVCKAIKVYHNPLPQNAGGISSTSSLTTAISIVQMAKALGFHVVWVENIDQGQVLTDSTTNLSNPAAYEWKWADYSAQVVIDAVSAQAAGADEFLVGNEIIGSNHYFSTDPGTLMPTAIYTAAFPGYVSGLVDACRASFTGVIGYQELDTVTSMWHSGTTPQLQHLDKIYFDTYEKYLNFQNSVTTESLDFGGKAAVGETSSVDVLGNIGYYVAYSEADWARELMRRYDFIRQNGLTAYLFTYGDPSSSSNGFGLRKNTSDNQTFHDIWYYLLRQRTISYTQYFYDLFPPDDFTGGSGGGGGGLNVDNTHTSAIATAPASDYVYRGRTQWQSNTGSVRLVARYTDANNYYCINIDVGNNQAKFIRRQTGVETQLGSTVPWPPHGSFEGSFSGSTFTPFDFEIRVQGQGAATSVWASMDTYKIVDQVDSGNTSLNSAQFGALYVNNTATIENVVCSSIEQINQLAIIGQNAEVMLDGVGYYVKPGSYKMHQPRVRKATVRADNNESYVDLGPGKRIWSMVILCINELLGYDGNSTGLTGQQYRDSLRNSYTDSTSSTVVFSSPLNNPVAVHFDDYIEAVRDLHSQIIGPGEGLTAGLSYEVAIVLIEA